MRPRHAVPRGVHRARCLATDERCYVDPRWYTNEHTNEYTNELLSNEIRTSIRTHRVYERVWTSIVFSHLINIVQPRRGDGSRDPSRRYVAAPMARRSCAATPASSGAPRARAATDTPSRSFGREFSRARRVSSSAARSATASLAAADRATTSSESSPSDFAAAAASVATCLLAPAADTAAALAGGHPGGRHPGGRHPSGRRDGDHRRLERGGATKRVIRIRVRSARGRGSR